VRFFLFLFFLFPSFTFAQSSFSSNLISAIENTPYDPVPALYSGSYTPADIPIDEVVEAPVKPPPRSNQVPSSPVSRSVRQASSSGFDLRGVTVGEVIQLIYGNALKTPYVLSPDVLLDTRPVSFRWSSGYGSLQAFLLRFLDNLGYKLEKIGNVDFVGKYDGQQGYEEFYIYKPKYRSVKYLTDVIGPMLNGHFNVSNQIGTETVSSEKGAGQATNTNALGRVGRDSDTLVYSGPPENIAKLKTLLNSLDLPGGEVLVRGLVYEVGFSKKEGSAFSLITSLFNGNLKIGVNSDVMGPGANFMSLQNVTIDFIANVLNSDSRFNVVSSPSLRIRSGEHGRFNVGEDVPVLGSIMYSKDSNPVQSVEYRSSGVIFDVRPQVFEQKINLDIDQQISNFIKTDTGVNSSPTLTKREISTSVSLANNEIIVLGGLAQVKNSNGSSGFSFLPDFFKANTKETARSELILVLQVSRIDS